jgi:multiple sugar transport system substrate-binding protein
MGVEFRTLAPAHTAEIVVFCVFPVVFLDLEGRTWHSAVTESRRGGRIGKPESSRRSAAEKQGDTTMTKSERSPSPSQVGMPIFGRRRLIVGTAAALGAGAVLAACGGDDDAGDTGAGATTGDTTAPAADPEPATDLGQVTFGSNYSDEIPRAAIAAAVATSGLDVAINTVDHNTYQQNFNTYIQQPDDVMCWFAGYRMRAFASRGVVGDISDVWQDLDGMSEGFRSAATGLDGNQYFVPLYFYPWAVHYRKSVFEENGYEVPVTWEDFLALCEQMEADGITPLAAANDGRWPQMGMFDMLNLRVNGYDFHVSLMGGNESWEDDRVKEIFARWEELLPYYQPDPNGRTWQDAATALGNGSAGMYLLGTFITSNFDPDAQCDIIDDIDFFAFPEVNPEHGQDAVEAPIDGFMMAANPANPDGAKALLTSLGQAAAVDAYIDVDPSVVGAHEDTDTAAYNAMQQKSAELVGSAKYIAQFLDRDTDPDFASNVVGVALADFLADPSRIDSILSTVEAQKGTYEFE